MENLSQDKSVVGATGNIFLSAAGSANEQAAEVARSRSIRIGEQVVTLDEETYQCIADDATQRGITFEQAYHEEMAARAELDRITPPPSALLEWAKNDGAPASLTPRPQ